MNIAKHNFQKILPFIFILNLALYSFSCKEEDEVIQVAPVPKIDTLMPSYTDTGAEIIVFRVNGRMVISEDRIQRTRGFSSGFFIPVHSTNYMFFINGGYISNARAEGIRIHVDDVIDTGIYTLKESNFTNRNQGQYYAGPTPFYGVVYTTRDNLKGYVHIKKIDTINGIISGTFEYDAKLFNYFGPENDSLSITDGWFDIHY